MGITSKELFLLKFEEQDHARFSGNIRSVLFKQFIFKLKVKEEIYNGEKQIKSIVMNADVVAPSSESKYLLGLISEMMSEEQNLNQNLSLNHVPSNDFGSDGHNGQNCPVSNRQVSGDSAFANRPLNNFTISRGIGAWQSSTAANVCFKCQQPGHWARYCPGTAAGIGGDGSSHGESNAPGRYDNK